MDKFEIKLANRIIGGNSPCFVIAEAGVNHNGDPELARRLIEVAADCKADAIKFQTFIPEKVISENAPKADYQKQTTGNSESQLEMVRKLALSSETFKNLQAYCLKLNIIFLSTPFDHTSIDMLADMKLAAFKVPSGEAVNIPFLRHAASKGLPLIISTGMCTQDEVVQAVDTVRRINQNIPVALLHCTTAYPAPVTESNLRAMDTLARACRVPVGLSDHTPGIQVSLSAVAMGANIIEKHFTLDKNLPGPDHRASLNPTELKMLIKEIRSVESSLGDGIKKPSPTEKDNLQIVRRSLASNRFLTKGTRLKAEDLCELRPETGIPCRDIDNILGRLLTRDLPMHTILQKEDLA